MTETYHFKQRIPAFVDPRGVTPTDCKWIKYEDCKKDPTLWQKFQEIK
jgi:hypothetical protein